MNTYGIRSINRETFNTSYGSDLYYPKPLRDSVITTLRINNSVLNILGYMRNTSPVSGCVRMAVGGAIIGLTLAVGNREAKKGAIIGRWYDEAIGTGVMQIARGTLEAFVPSGWMVNLALDIVATPFNFAKEITGSMMCEGCRRGGHDREADCQRPHSDVDYPFPLSVLQLV